MQPFLILISDANSSPDRHDETYSTICMSSVQSGAERVITVSSIAGRSPSATGLPINKWDVGLLRPRDPNYNESSFPEFPPLGRGQGFFLGETCTALWFWRTPKNDNLF